MTPAEMIQKRKSRLSANANSAKGANNEEPRTQPFAKLAAFALAKPGDSISSELLSNETCNDQVVYSWWWIYYRDQVCLEVVYSASATHREVMEWNPDAIGAEPWVRTLKHPTAPLNLEEESSLRSWLQHIGERDATSVDDVLDQCETDADARKYFLEYATVANRNVKTAEE